MRRLTTTFTVVTALCLAFCATSASAVVPVILKTSSSHVTATSATLEAEVNPGGKAGKYHFEYGLADCSSNPCTSTPESALKKTEVPVPLKADVESLVPGATYHFRVLAKNDESAVGPDITFTTYQLPLVFGPCLNDAFRVGRPSGALPDCRAYEQASPVKKNGVDAFGRVSWVKASPNGGAVSFLTTSGIPGSDGAQELPGSLATRGSDSWSTQGMLPPASAGEEAFVLGWTPDFAQIFSSARRLGPPKTLAFLARSTADRSIEPIVDYDEGLLADPKFAGTSGDGGQILFESSTKLLPHALEGKSNLYLWDRVSKALHLASILNDNTAPPQGAFAGSYDWIAGAGSPACPGISNSLDCGGATAYHYTQDEHALSAVGSVYFTAAGSGQLYLRQNPTEEQSPLDAEGKCANPVLACTLHISVSRKDNGTGLGNTDAAGAQPAAFMAATPDGSKAFFASSEKLTNDATTGPEPLPPALASSNLAAGDRDPNCLLTSARGVAVDSAHIYWANPKAGTIGRADLNGCGNPEPNFVTGADNPQYVAVDAEHLYWTSDAGKGDTGEGAIGRAKLGAGGAEEIDQDFIEGASKPQGIAVNSEYVYWANAGGTFETRTIGRAKLGAGAAEEIDQDFIGVDSGIQEHTPQGIAINASHIYAAVNSTQEFSSIKRWDINGGSAAPVTFFDSQHLNIPGLRGIALDAGHVYWARQGFDTIGRINLELEASSAEDREFIGEAGHPQGLAVDGARIYWSANGEIPPNAGNDLYRYDVAKDELRDITVDTGDRNGAEVKGVLGTSNDGTYVYFAANGVLAAGATPGDCKGSAANSISFSGECNLYLAHEGEATRFIARLDADGTDPNGGDTDAVNWVPHNLTKQFGKTAQVSADGRTLLFRSQRQLSAYDNDDSAELYRYRAGDPGLTCVSCNPTGEAPKGAPRLGSIEIPSILLIPDPASTLSRNLSADGNRVFFETTDALVGADTNGLKGCPEVGTFQVRFPTCQDVYEWEANGTGSCQSEGGCFYLLSTGKSPVASFFADASASGDDAFLITRSGLVGQDRDQSYDVYDTRVGGGLAAQNQQSPVTCEGDACKPGLAPPPAFEAPQTPHFKGSGNFKKIFCPKAKRKSKGKSKAGCSSKKRHKQSKGKNRNAKQTGRSSR